MSGNIGPAQRAGSEDRENEQRFDSHLSLDCIPIYFSPSELRQPDCFYDEAHCSAFCEQAKAEAAAGGQPAAKLAKPSQPAGSSLQAIRLVCQVQVLQLASVENHFLVSPLMTIWVTLSLCRVLPAQCFCDSGDCKAFVRLERCHSRISVRCSSIFSQELSAIQPQTFLIRHTMPYFGVKGLKRSPYVKNKKN